MAFTTLAICLILIGARILTTLVTAEGCFRNRAIFEENTRYMQTLYLKNWINYSPGFSDANKMTAEAEEERYRYYVNNTYTCLEEFKGNRMLVEVKDEEKDKIQYQCLQFTKLTKYVTRQAKTRLRNTKEEVDCEDDRYDTDDAVLVAMDDIQPEECPLDGGYQMLIESKNYLCSENIFRYNPNIRFQCSSNGVIADINEYCLPSDLTKYQKMRSRFVSHLTCIGSWYERRGGIQTVLLRMRDMPNDVWCLHYKQKDGDDFLSMFMSVDGRCLENPFYRSSYKKETSFSGNLAKYVPHKDHNCSDSDYLDRCKTPYIGSRCTSSIECPGSCNRCNYKVPKQNCTFDQSIRGNWKTTPNSNHDLMVDIGEKSFNASKHGEFSCDERPNIVVQNYESTSCMPYYACIKINSPAPGVLNFQLQPVKRDRYNGDPQSCLQTRINAGYIYNVFEEQDITMFDTAKLEESSCGFEKARKFRTSIRNSYDTACMLAVDKCVGNCSNLIVKYDRKTCGENPTPGFELETGHVCYGTFNFTLSLDDYPVLGMLTYSNISEKYRCWIYSKDYIFVAPPDDCNPKRVNYIQFVYGQTRGTEKYEPRKVLGRTIPGYTVVTPAIQDDKETTSKGPGGDANRWRPNNWLVVFSGCVLLPFLSQFKIM